MKRMIGIMAASLLACGVYAASWSTTVSTNGTPNIIVPALNNQTYTAWSAGATVTAGDYITSQGKKYFVVAGGTTTNAPTHTRGLVITDGISWYAMPTRYTQVILSIEDDTSEIYTFSPDTTGLDSSWTTGAGFKLWRYVPARVYDASEAGKGIWAESTTTPTNYTILVEITL